MRKALVIILFAISQSGFAQFTEIGLQAGGTNFIGDVGNAFTLPQGWVAGINVRHQFNGYYGARIFGNIGTMQAFDNQSNQAFKADRNLSFRTDLWEVGGVMEINFFEYVTGSKKMNHSPYLFVGLSIFGFNPQGQFIDGDWYDLQPLSTEGQQTEQNRRARYDLTGIAIPFGLGYRFSLGKSISLAVEAGFRPTSTDYLDDASGKYVNTTQLAEDANSLSAYFADRSLSSTDKTGSPRANNQYNDWYLFTGFHLYFTLTSKNERCKRF